MAFIALPCFAMPVYAMSKPNVVLMEMDKTGWREPALSNNSSESQVPFPIVLIIKAKILPLFHPQEVKIRPMNGAIQLWEFLLIALSVWVNRSQQKVVNYLIEENRVLKGKLNGKGIQFSDDE